MPVTPFFPSATDEYSSFPEAELDSPIWDIVDRAGELNVRRRRYLKDKYAWRISSGSKMVRSKAQSAAAKEIKNPQERAFLIDAVAEISRAKAWDRRRQVAGNGYATRFRKNIRETGQATGESIYDTMNNIRKVASGALGGIEDDVDIRFTRGLEAAKETENPEFIQEDTGASQGLAVDIGRSLPALGGGLVALGAAGPIGGAGFWAVQEFPEQREQFVEAGHGGVESTLFGATTAGAIGAIEMALPDPFKSKGPAGTLVRKAARGFTRLPGVSQAVTVAGRIGGKGFGRKQAARFAKEIPEAIGRGVVESVEESLQAATEEAGQQLAAGVASNVEARPRGEILSRGAEAFIEAGPVVGTLAAGGLGGRMQHVKKNYAKFEAGSLRSKTHADIMHHAIENLPVSRRQIRKWGLEIEEKSTAASRLARTKEIAAELQSVARIWAIDNNVAPTEEQWEYWGMRRLENSTPQKRLDYLRAEVAEGKRIYDEEARARGEIIAEEGQRLTDDQTAVALDEVLAESSQEGVAEGVEGQQATETEQESLEESSAGRLGKEGTGTPSKPKTPSSVTEAAVMDRPEIDIRAEEIAAQGTLGTFVKDNAGRVGLRLGAAEKGIRKAKHWLKEFIVTGGELSGNIWDTYILRNAELAKIKTELNFAVRRFNKAAKASFGNRDLSEENRVKVDRLLRGQVEPQQSGLPVEMQNSIGELRTMIDDLSQRLIDSGVVQGKMTGVVSGNKGVWLTRTYKAFTDKRYADTVGQDKINAVVNLLRQQYPGWSEAKIHGKIEQMLYEGKAAEAPILAQIGSEFRGEDKGILKPRILMSQEIRDLLGENIDPLFNAVQSVNKLAELVVNHEFLEGIVEAGEGKWFSKHEPMITEFGVLKTRISAEGSERLAPMNGVYTTPEIKEAFLKLMSPDAQPNWLRVYFKVNAAVKLSKTVYSAMTHVRNFVGNAGFAVMQGHWRAGKMGKAFQPLITKSSWATKKLKIDQKKFEQYYLEAVRLGVVGESVRASEMQDVFQDAINQTTEEFLFGPTPQDAENRLKRDLKRVGRVVAGVPMTMYQLEDDIWKLYAWENEKARYKKAKSNWSDEKIKEHTAKIVRNTYPTYSMVPGSIKSLRKFPLLGTFVSFPAEVYRTSFNTMRIIAEESRDPDLRGIAAQRIAGVSATTVGMSAAFKAIAYMFGMGNDDDEALREFRYEWQKNAQFLNFGQRKNGNYVSIDTSYSDPHSQIKEIYKAFLRGDDFEEATIDAIKQTFEPFFSEEILARRIGEAWTGQEERGSVWNQEDPWFEKLGRSVVHVAESAEPGTVTSGRRIYKGFAGITSPGGRVYDPANEILAVITGQRIQDTNVEQSLSFAGSAYSRRYVNANRALSQVTNSRGTVTAKQVKAAHRKAEALRQNVFNDFKKTFDAAVHLGVSPGRALQVLLDAGVTKADAISVANGTYRPLEINKRRFTSMADATRKLEGQFQLRAVALQQSIMDMRSENQQEPQ